MALGVSVKSENVCVCVRTREREEVALREEMSVCVCVCVCVCWSVSRVQLFENPWTIALLSMGFSRQKYWSGWPFPSPGDPPDSGIEPESPESQADSV